jgi:hypothetical protein
MPDLRTKWLIAGAFLCAGAGFAVLAVIQRSPILAEWFGGLDVESARIIPASRKNDRLEVPDPSVYIARQDEAHHRRHGRPSIDAIWAARMTLPAPGQWVREASPPPPLDPTAPLAYAAARATDPPDRDPFHVVDEGAGIMPSATLIPIPLPRPQIAAVEEEMDEEEDEDQIPIPMPRPRNVPAPVQMAVANPPSPPARGAPVTLMPAPPSAAAQRPDTGRVQMASLTAPTERDPVARPPAPTIMTPFGVPFVLQHDSVQTNCFPPALVELLRRIERHYGQKPVITSGYRTRGRSGSLHRRCMAADIMIPGVPGAELARVARTIPGMGGVGMYCHPTLVHIDIGTARDWRYGCGSFFAMRDGSASWGRVPGRVVNRN